MRVIAPRSVCFALKSPIPASGPEQRGTVFENSKSARASFYAGVWQDETGLTNVLWRSRACRWSTGRPRHRLGWARRERRSRGHPLESPQAESNDLYNLANNVPGNAGPNLWAKIEPHPERTL